MERTEVEKEVIMCDCGAHALVIESEIESTDDTVDKEILSMHNISIAMFSYGHYSSKPGLLHRIKIAWKMLTKGTIYLDQVSLNSVEAKKFADFINSVLNKEIK